MFFKSIFKKRESKPFVLLYHGMIKKGFKDPLNQFLYRNMISENNFVKQMKYLNTTFFLEDLSKINNFKQIEKNRIFIQFDDGYKNNIKSIDIINDIFKKNNCTIFIPSRFLESDQLSIDTVKLGLVMLKSNFKDNRLIFSDIIYDMKSVEERLKNYQIIRYKLKRMKTKNRIESYKYIFSQKINSTIEELLDLESDFKLLNMKQVNYLKMNNVFIQPHGHAHEILHDKQDKSLVKEEIIKSSNFFRNILNITPKYFSYPNGNYTNYAIEELKKEKYIGAFTTQNGNIFDKKNNYDIPRISAPSSLNKLKQMIKLFC